MGFSQGLSGLNAAASNLDVIGNNVANQSTVGFKSGTATFADVFASSRVGMGVQVTGVNQRFSTGSITTTSNELDMAIDGANGFFRLIDTDGSVVYSRNGQFYTDADNNIVNAQGQQLTGYPAGAVGADPVALSVPTGNIAPSATTTVTVSSLNLDSDATVITEDFDITDSSTYTYTTPTTVYDSLGNTHELRQYYAKTGEGTDTSTWSVYYVLDGDTSQIGTATLTFDSDGVLTSPTDPVELTFDVEPATDLAISFDYGDTTTQFAGDSTLNATQDGYATGQFSAVEVAADGTLYATYTNGQSQAFGVVVLASFNSTQGLQPVGGNAWTETADSGAPTLGQPGSNSLGTLVGQAVEASNVDVSEELVNMIIAQRTYQANAQTIKTQDNILQTLVTMR
ncbi:MAG: flagellar hook protein FlgE [Comamonas sp.]